MVTKKMSKIIILLILFNIFFFKNVIALEQNFDTWLIDFKIKAINSGISENVVDDVLSNAKFLPKVIEYDRFQPEFYEDTLTYIKKRYLYLL